LRTGPLNAAACSGVTPEQYTENTGSLSSRSRVFCGGGFCFFSPKDKADYSPRSDCEQGSEWQLFHFVESGALKHHLSLRGVY
jgi:hypothetical protein